MSEPARSIELSVDVEGGVEEVWRAVATGPGISSWYVPHEVEERPGGSAVASFGDTPEMQIPGRVAVWEPPRRIVFDGGDAGGGLTFEWIVEPLGAGLCTVRLINAGFGPAGDPDQDAQYDMMAEGWKLFMLNLRLHCQHFLGQVASSALPMQPTELRQADAWNALCSRLGVSTTLTVGDRIDVPVGPRTSIVGTVVEARPFAAALLLDSPLRGTAFIASEGATNAMVSMWLYLYGEDASDLASTAKPALQALLAEVEAGA